MTPQNKAHGCLLPLEDWLDLNRTQVFKNPQLREQVSPFPPPDLMQIVSGLTSEEDFAAHGTDIYRALSAASHKPLTQYEGILDFGCGCGRLARMFKGHPHRIAGCDIDVRLVTWVKENLPFMEAEVSRTKPPIPYSDNEFEAVISISIFTHLTEACQDQFLAELHRVCRAGGRLFLTVHGERALVRAQTEERIRSMLDVEEDRFLSAQQDFKNQKHAFILQSGHLTTVDSGGQVSTKDKAVNEPFEYGITFIPKEYLFSHWGRWFKIENYVAGGIHDFQDIAVLVPKK